MQEKDKQVEEMRKDVASIHRFFFEDDDYEVLDDYIADMLFARGYRKASEVAEEIFAEIEDVLNNIGYFDELDFEALKKKYIGKDTNVTTKETEDN